MKTLIISPLFPPDTGAPASYVKELATRLGTSTSLLIYGYLPEDVPTVSITAIDKRASLPLRLYRFTVALFTSENIDCFLVNNAPSVELPFFIFYLLKRPCFVLIESDSLLQKSTLRGWYRFVHTYLSKRAKNVVVVSEAIYAKAELLPFTEFDTVKESAREAWWQEHCNELTA
jgi:hypothetical protein